MKGNPMPELMIKIGFVPSYRGDFGPPPAWCVQMRAEALAAFRKITGLQIVAPTPCPDDDKQVDTLHGYTPAGMVGNLDQGEAVAEYFMQQKVDGIIIGALDFGDERSTAKVAEKLRVPALLYATKEPPAPDAPSMARVSDSYCGTLSIASALYRRRIPFHYAGIFFHDDAEFLSEVDSFVRAVSAVKGLKNARIGQVGVRPASFETVGYDEAAMIRKFGQNVIFAEVSEIVQRAQQYADADPLVVETVKSIRGEVAQATVSGEFLVKTAKLELAAAKFFEQHKLSAMAMQCWPSLQQIYGLSPCSLFGRLTGRGMLTACEADILGALAMLVQYRAALGATAPHFIDWTIRHREKENRFLAWHCGNAPVCLAAHPRETALRSRRDMKGALEADPSDAMAGLCQFQIRPGKVTLCRLQEYDGQWKMLIAAGEIIPSDETLAGTWSWVEVRDHRKLYRTLVEEGFVHHASMIHGDQTQALQEACKFLDIRPVVV
jgi:L-fucose isomerase-like protein